MICRVFSLILVLGLLPVAPYGAEAQQAAKVARIGYLGDDPAAGIHLRAVGKCLEQLKQAVPGVSRIAVLRQPGAVGQLTEKDMLTGAKVAARALRVQLQFAETRGPADLDKAFAKMAQARAGALTVLPSPMFFNERRRLVDLAAKHRLPAVYASREFVAAGGLMAYGPDIADLYRRAATYVDKILKGAKPADLPVEQPTKFELAINLKAAKALGLSIPSSVLVQADQVIE
jgi:putative ABC transport system substrate-binding protein